MPLPEFTQIYLFIGACLALVSIPGPAVAFIVVRGVSEGTKAALRTAAGIAVGNLCQALAAAFGLAALLVSYPSVYLWIKYAGASYLIYLGLRSFFAKANSRASIDAFVSPGSSRRTIESEGRAFSTRFPPPVHQFRKW